MHKAGGWIALIAALCVIGATFLSAALAEEGIEQSGMALGGFAMGPILIVLSIIILNTRSKVPVLVMLAGIAIFFFMDIPDNLAMIPLAFAALGGIFALFK